MSGEDSKYPVVVFEQGGVRVVATGPKKGVLEMRVVNTMKQHVWVPEKGYNWGPIANACATLWAETELVKEQHQPAVQAYEKWREWAVTSDNLDGSWADNSVDDETLRCSLSNALHAKRISNDVLKTIAEHLRGRARLTHISGKPGPATPMRARHRRPS